jgi:apolipoprotein N-acyltransferase
MTWSERALVGLRCVVAGLLVAASVPPWGWWPLAFVGLAMWDRLLADQRAIVRFRRSWLVAAAWLFPAMLWMWDLTKPGYVIACATYAAYFGVAMLLVPATRPARWLAFPAAIVVAELWRWTFPFGGVPLASLAMGQAAAPLGQAARLGTAIFVSGLVAVGGVALSAALEHRWRVAAVATALVVGFSAAGWAAPRGERTGPVTYAIVQGGGPQGTRAADTDEREVFERHLDASAEIVPPVDLVLWPENVVSVEGNLVDAQEGDELSALARQLDTTIVAGVTEGDGPTRFRNASIVVLPDGTIGGRYDKVRRVPFGEYVPLRSLLESIAGDAGFSRRDAIEGEGPAIVRTPPGTFGVVISWEVFFTNRAREGVLNGGEALLNPTNGSSYWLTQVQTQQVASSRLRAIETGRWLLQAAPTGFSGVVDPDGTLLVRSAISERWVHQGEIETRQGDTIALVVGPMPVLFIAVGALVGAHLLRRRRSEHDLTVERE